MFVCEQATDRIFVVLGVCKRGSTMVPVRRLLNDDDGGLNLFKIQTDPVELHHVTHPMSWIVIPTKPVCPAMAVSRFPNVSRRTMGIFFQQVAAAVPLMKYSLTVPHDFSLKELQRLVGLLGIVLEDVRWTRSMLIVKICYLMCDGLLQAEIDDFIKTARHIHETTNYNKLK